MRSGCCVPFSLEGASTASTFESFTEPKSVTKGPKYALLFDCDGVIVLTEELHRKAYNGAFKHFNLKIKGEPVVWTEEYYDVLQVTYVRQWVGVPLFRPPLLTCLSAHALERGWGAPTLAHVPLCPCAGAWMGGTHMFP